MAINFLNGINLNQNQLIKAAIENQPGDIAAGVGVEGQVYFDTSPSAKALKVWNGTGWVGVGGGVTTFTASNGTFISFTPTTLQTGAVTLTGNLSATGIPSSSTYLRGDNTWAVVSSYDGWKLTGDTGTPQTIASTDEVYIRGGVLISTVVSATDTLTIDHDNVTRADTTSSASPALGATFTAVDSVTTNSTGHITALNLKTVTLPTTAVTQATGNNSTLIATTAFVQAALTGLLEFKGGFNASTGAITSGSNNGLFLWGATRVALEIGDYYVATVAGDFYGDALYPLTPGDSVIATVARAVDTSLVTDWSVIQSDTDLATLSTVGIGNVNAGAGITVSYLNGTATVAATDAGLRGKKIILSVSTGVTKVTSGGLTTFTINLATAWAAGIEASNVMCEVIDNTSFSTVYAELGRTSAVSTNLTVAMTGTVADGLYYVLLQNVE